MITCYVMHRYWDESPTVRAANVTSAAKLARAVLRAGFAVYAPLQVSVGIEDALDERGWLEHGLLWLRKCDVAVCPEGHADTSRGCRKEIAVADDLGIVVCGVWLEEGRWKLPPGLVRMAERRPMTTTILGGK